MSERTIKYIVEYQEDAGGNWYMRDYSRNRLAAESVLQRYVKNTTFHAWRILMETTDRTVLNTVAVKKPLIKEKLIKILMDENNTFIYDSKVYYVDYVDELSNTFGLKHKEHLIHSYFDDVEIGSTWIKCKHSELRQYIFTVCKKLNLD